MNAFPQIVTLFVFLATNMPVHSNEGITVAPGSSLSKVQQAIDKAHVQGGGIVVLKSGEYTLDRALDLSNKQNVTLLGEDGAVLKAAAQQIANLVENASAGATRLVLDKPLNISSGMRVEIHSPGRKVVTPSGNFLPRLMLWGR